MKFAFIKDTNGRHSTSLTMGVTAFIVVLSWLALSIFKSILGIEIRAFDGAAAMAFLSPVLALYGYRRKTKDVDEKKAQKLSQEQQDFSDK